MTNLDQQHDKQEALREGRSPAPQVLSAGERICLALGIETDREGTLPLDEMLTAIELMREDLHAAQDAARAEAQELDQMTVKRRDVEQALRFLRKDPQSATAQEFADQMLAHALPQATYRALRAPGSAA